MLHGRGGHLETFERNIPDLASAGYRVTAFDLLGHGLTEAAGNRYDIGELLSHAGAVVDAVAPNGAVLIGQSLGGWIASLLVTQKRHRGLVLIEPAGYQSMAERFSDPKVKAAAEAGGRAFDDATEENVALRFRQLLHESASLDPEMVALRARFYRQPGAGQVHKSVRTADNSRWQLNGDALVGADAAPLIIRGVHGHVPAATLADVAHRAGGYLASVADAKQWPHYENPALVNRIIGDYLKERTQ
jgi:pimeloyl-ACP methyl ester carboxylesterase